METPARTEKSRMDAAFAWKTAGLTLISCGLYLLVGGLAADRLTRTRRLFDPANTPGRQGLPYEDVRFPARDGRAEIAAWFIPSPANSRVVILVHGIEASRTAAFVNRFPEVAAGLARAGLAVLMLDLRGHGLSSPSRFSFGLRERYDILGAVDWLRGRGFQPGKIGLLGVSLGAGSSIGAAAAEPAVGALVTDSSFADIGPIVEANWRKRSGLPQFFLGGARLMARVLCGEDIYAARPVDELPALAPRPVLLIHTELDQDVPLSHLQQLHAALPAAETWVVRAGQHAEIYNALPDEYLARVVGFFDRQL